MARTTACLENSSPADSQGRSNNPRAPVSQLELFWTTTRQRNDGAMCLNEVSPGWFLRKELSTAKRVSIDNILDDRPQLFGPVESNVHMPNEGRQVFPIAVCVVILPLSNAPPTG